MKRFALYFSDLTPAAQKEWVDTFGEKPMELVPMHLFEVYEVDDYDDDDDDESVDKNSMEVDGFGFPECIGCNDKYLCGTSDCKVARSASGEEFDAWL